MNALTTASDHFELPQDIHFLNRISYGPTSATVSEVAQLGWSATLENQLDYQSIDTSEIDTTLADAFPSLELTPAEIVAAEDEELFNKLVPDLIMSTVLRQLYSPAQLYERMVEFWSDHFNMNVLDSRVRLFKITDDRESIRPNAMGKFRDLLYANAHSPAMMLYLDNYSNTKQGPNENYARELLELHTLGVDGGYNEADIVEVARAFTGWTVSRRSLTFSFRFELHDRGPKTVLGQPLENTFWGGISDGEQVLDLLASHPSTARFICTKLARRFVSDDPPELLVDEMAETFLATDGDVKALLRVLFNSESFWTSQEMKMKRPLDFLTSTVRRFGIQADKKLFSYFHSRLKQMGQVPFLWHAPNGYPDTAQYWTNTAALVSRWSTGKDTAFFLPRATFSTILAGANTPRRIIQAMSQALIDRNLDPQEHDILQHTVFEALPPDQPVNRDPVNFARVVAIALIGSRYFQMR
ncbi:MAG: DUF1800 domain-containing protein [Halieaceae bacterium]|jgi:uncharacterized protein (DUF1800 family)|nr:DUF1800 domain-containing protein [Halieaceae bacterium]